MSLEQVNQILGRALLDETFREQLLQNPGQVLREFDLTNQEVEALKRINAGQFQKLNDAFQAQLGGVEANSTQATNFTKLESTRFLKIEGGSYLKLSSMGEGVGTRTTNAWPSKVVPGSPTAAGLSLPTILAVGAAVVVVLGAVAASIFFFRAADAGEAGAGSQPIMQVPEEDGTLPQTAVLEPGEDAICLTSEDLHLCAVPAGQVADQLGDTADDPIMLPLTPEQAALLISASGGSPPGVQGFTMMMLAGPETYRIQLPDTSAGIDAVFLADAQGGLYFGSGDYFSNETLDSGPEPEQGTSLDAVASLAGNWEGLSAPGVMTCNGASMNTPAEPPTQVVFNDSGQGTVAQELVDDSIVEITSFSDGIYLASVTTMVEGEAVNGEFEFSLVSPGVIEGSYTAAYENGCVFERPITMNRVSSADADNGENLAPLKPAEFSVEEVFNPGEIFIPQGAVCAYFPVVCEGEITAFESIDAMMSAWGTFDGDIFMHVGGGGGAGKVNISQNCDSGDSSDTGTTCVPAPEKGDAYIPPYPADAGWGSKGIGNPTLVSVLDVDALSVINGIYDLWMVMGVPTADDWNGYIDLNSELIQVYELDLSAGQQALWEEVKVTYDTVDITTDRNRLFIIYLFEDEAAALASPPSYP